MLLLPSALWIPSSSLGWPSLAARLSSLLEELEERGDTEELFGCRRGRAEMEVMTDTSLGQSVVSVRQDCSMLGVLFPARSTMALKALFRGDPWLSREDTGEAQELVEWH